MKRTLALVALLGLLVAMTPSAAPGSGRYTIGSRSMIKARQRFFGKDNVNPRTGEVR